MTTQQLMSYVRSACEHYDMIQPGDRIAVGISGGKDSLSLLCALANMRRFYPKSYELEAITVSLGFPGTDFSPVEEFCTRLGVGYTVVDSNIGPLVFEERKEKNSCSLCSKMRKGVLNGEAKRLGCNKIAYGHNRDDVIETLFMALFYEGRIHSFSPVSYLSRADVTLIRPLIFTPESSIRNYVRENKITVVKSPCPANGETKRADMKEFVKEQRRLYPYFDEKIFSAVQNSKIEGWSKSLEA